MKYIPDLIFETDEQNLNEFYKTLYIDIEKRFDKGLFSLSDLEDMLNKNEYPQINGAREILQKFIHCKKIILCSSFEHKGTAF